MSSAAAHRTSPGKPSRQSLASCARRSSASTAGASARGTAYSISRNRTRRRPPLHLGSGAVPPGPAAPPGREIISPYVQRDIDLNPLALKPPQAQGLLLIVGA